MIYKTSFLFTAFRSPVGALIILMMMGSGCGKHSISPAPSQSFSVVLGAEQNVISPASPGLLFSPDEHLSYLPNGTGSFNIWFAADAGTVGFSTPDLLNFTPLKSDNEVPSPLLAPSGPGSAAFDADYAGSGSVFRAANGSDLLMIYHAENHLFGNVLSNGNPFYAGIGLAGSSDDGITWVRQGQILSAHDPQLASQTSGGTGIGTPAAIEANGYVYVFFREIDHQTNIEGIGIARAPVSGDAVSGSWQKFFNGAYSSPGLGGAFTPFQITLDINANSDHRQPFVTFNTYLNAYVLLIVGNGGIYMCTSTDLVTWTAGKVILPAPVPDATVTPSTAPYNWYPTLVSPGQPSETITNKEGYLYYAKGADDGTSHHTMYRRSFILSITQ